MTSNSEKEDAMHPMFVKLFLADDADDAAAEEEERRRGRRARRLRAVMVTRAASG